MMSSARAGLGVMGEQQCCGSPIEGHSTHTGGDKRLSGGTVESEGAGHARQRGQRMQRLSPWQQWAHSGVTCTGTAKDY